jgi:peptide methionine sulfoxide reductase msrA/msrB
MKTILIIIGLFLFFSGCQLTNNSNETMKYTKLTPEEERVIKTKGTEAPFSGKYYNFNGKGTYLCKQCYAPLYKSENKFDSGCGWPSFDEEIKGAVVKQLDADGQRTEITCANCGAHLGHVFYGEGFTDKDTRHCVNSISMVFIPEKSETKIDTAIFSSGCFWGTQFYFNKLEGILSTTVGYTGGHTDAPTYKEVCAGNTGHLEAVEVVFDTSKISYETVCKYFFETHDFTQTNGQGPDIGEQYLSAIFYRNMEQKEIAEKIVSILTDKGYKVATLLKPAKTFWKAEDYHQEYYEKKGTTPYCHIYKKIF